jgi:Glucodextranase, domain B
MSMHAGENHHRRLVLSSHRLRRVLAFLSSVALAALLAPAAALAIVETSQITTPATSPIYPFGEGKAKFAVAGTTNIASKVEIRCYKGPTTSTTVATVPVASGAFTAEVEVSGLGRAPCQLRAVPVGYKEAQPPGVETQFKGPLVAPASFSSEPTFFIGEVSSLAGGFSIEPAGTFGLESEVLTTKSHEDVDTFYGEGDLGDRLIFETVAPRVQVDGAYGYLPTDANELNHELEEAAKKNSESFTPLTGIPAVTVTKSLNEATHEMTIHEQDPVVKCAPSSAFPATPSTCTGLVSTGVTLMRTWQTSGEDHVASMSDTWRSTDGTAHTVLAQYATEMHGSGAEGGSYEFPGESGFAATHEGETRNLPSGPGTILYKTAVEEPEAGNGEDPVAAIVYDASPSKPVSVTIGTSPVSFFNSNLFTMPYERSVPAGGTSSTLRMGFVQGLSFGEVRPLAEAVLAGFHPSVSIGSPGNGATLSTPTVTVSGTAADGAGLTSVTVDGQAVSTGGAWSTNVSLKEGANTITATATDQAGLTASTSILVTYTPPLKPAVASAVGFVSGAKGKATLTLSCSGATGTSCAVQATLTTVEHKRKGRLLGVAAKAKTTSVKVAVGSANVTIDPGHRMTITITLNATGRKLLKRFGKLPVHLGVTSTSQGAKTTVIAQNLLIKPPPPRRHRH